MLITYHTTPNFCLHHFILLVIMLSSDHDTQHEKHMLPPACWPHMKEHCGVTATTVNYNNQANPLICNFPDIVYLCLKHQHQDSHAHGEQASRPETSNGLGLEARWQIIQPSDSSQIDKTVPCNSFYSKPGKQVYITGVLHHKSKSLDYI